MSSIQSLLDIAQAEFAGAEGDGGGRWVGLDADARLRLSRRVREEVLRLGDVFARVRADIDAVPGGGVPPEELLAALAAEARELARLQGAQRSLEALLAGRGVGGEAEAGLPAAAAAAVEGGATRVEGGAAEGGAQRRRAGEEDVAMR